MCMSLWNHISLSKAIIFQCGYHPEMICGAESSLSFNVYILAEQIMLEYVLRRYNLACLYSLKSRTPPKAEQHYKCASSQSCIVIGL